MENKNAERFIKGPIHYFKLIGFEVDSKHGWMKLLLIAGLINMALILLSQVILLALADMEFHERNTHITFINYFAVSFGKVTALLYNRKAIREALNEFGEIYPPIQLEKAFNLKTHLKQYLQIERILSRFFRCVTPFYSFLPLAYSLVELLRFGSCIHRMPLLLWYPFDFRIQNWLYYGLSYTQQVWSCFESSIIILGVDLCLFSSLVQMTMHFEIITRNILQIAPDGSDEAEKRLKEQIAYHQRVLGLADSVNDVFTPSVLFSLLSSSVIICFVGYQMLGDITLMVVAKSMLLLAYELKQVVITCFLSDKLSGISVKVSDSIYEHNWYNGTPNYKRLVLIMLMRSQKRVALNIAGVSDVSLQTLRQVLSISYQIFTVLKSG